MSFKDIIKSSVYENLGGGTGLSASMIVLTMGIAILIGMYIFMVYRTSSKAAFYSKDLNITIAGMPVIIAAIMIAMQSNFIVSLGMVGALSIVRFRNALKNPLDLLYLFWSVSAGIVCGVGLKLLAVVLCMMMTLLIFILQLIPNFRPSSILVLRSESEEINWLEIKKIINHYGKNVKQKSRTIQHGVTEIIYELTIGSEEELISELRKLNQLAEISFLSYDGEFRI